MDERKEVLLKLIIHNYIQTAEPVGSNFLVEHASLKLSGATVRNEMRELEEQGFLTHPHTSAGRIPTELGYQYYLEKIIQSKEPSVNLKKDLEKIIGVFSSETDKIKASAKYISQIINNAVIVAFNEDSVYYTGIANLFSQPEFKDYLETVRISTIFDHCEENLSEVFSKIDEQSVSVLLGEKNPLGSSCSFIASKFNNGKMFGILGPMRMNYERNIGLVEYFVKLLNA